MTRADPGGHPGTANAIPVRRTDKLMSADRAVELMVHGYAGRLATVGPDGWPYVERMTGKETPLPAPPDRWPAADHTRTPGAIPPARP